MGAYSCMRPLQALEGDGGDAAQRGDSQQHRLRNKPTGSDGKTAPAAGGAAGAQVSAATGRDGPVSPVRERRGKGRRSSEAPSEVGEVVVAEEGRRRESRRMREMGQGGKLESDLTRVDRGRRKAGIEALEPPQSRKGTASWTGDRKAVNKAARRHADSDVMRDAHDARHQAQQVAGRDEAAAQAGGQATRHSLRQRQRAQREMGSSEAPSQVVASAGRGSPADPVSSAVTGVAPRKSASVSGSAGGLAARRKGGGGAAGEEQQAESAQPAVL